MRKQIVRLTESDLHRIIKESVKKILKETDCAGVMQTGCGDAPKGTNPEAGQYTVPFGADKDTADRTPGKVAMGGRAKWNVNNGNVQRREIYNPKSGKKKLGESMYDDDWSNYEDGLDYLYDKYSEDYGREDPTYQMQKNDYNGIISMLKQYGYNAEIEDNDPEGEYPPVLTVIENPYRRRRFGIDKLTKFLESRGWKLDNQYSGERTKNGIKYMFRKNM